MTRSIESLEHRSYLAAPLVDPQPLENDPVMVDGVLFITGDTRPEGVRVVRVPSTEDVDTEAWQFLKLKGGYPELSGWVSETLLPVTENSAELIGPYIRVSSRHRNWFFRTAEVSKIVINMDAGEDFVALGKSLRTRTQVLGGPGNDLLYGGGAKANISGNGGKDVILGGDASESLNGNAANDLIRGGRGNDSINGGDGNDSLFGEEGEDSLYGEAGTDALIGGKGRDRMLGGDDPDYFKAKDVFGNNDVMYGGGGDDTVVSADADDTYQEAAG